MPVTLSISDHKSFLAHFHVVHCDMHICRLFPLLLYLQLSNEDIQFLQLLPGWCSPDSEKSIVINRDKLCYSAGLQNSCLCVGTPSTVSCLAILVFIQKVIVQRLYKISKLPIYWICQALFWHFIRWSTIKGRFWIIFHSKLKHHSCLVSGNFTH